MLNLVCYVRQYYCSRSALLTNTVNGNWLKNVCEHLMSLLRLFLLKLFRGTLR